MNREFFTPEEIQLILQRNFSIFPNCFSFSGEKITGVVLNDRDIWIFINDVTISNATGILLVSQEPYNIIEISSIETSLRSPEKLSVTHTFPLNGLWHFGVCMKIKPTNNDNHGNKDD